MIGEVMNATTYTGALVQGRVVYVGPRRWGPHPRERVAVLVGERTWRGWTWVCPAHALREPPRYRITVRFPA